MENCTSCNLSKVLQNGICGDSCSSGFGPVGGVCTACADQRCKTCLDVNTCSECSGENALLDGECFEVCPIRHRLNTSGAVRVC